MRLRDSGLVNESRAENGKMLYRIWTNDRMFQVTMPKHQDTQTLVTSRLNACENLEQQLTVAGLSIADVIPPTDSRGVILK